MVVEFDTFSRFDDVGDFYNFMVYWPLPFLPRKESSAKVGLGSGIWKWRRRQFSKQVRMGRGRARRQGELEGRSEG